MEGASGHVRAGQAQAALARLAQAVDADHGARLYVDRGDGVLEIVADIDRAAAARPPGDSGRDGARGRPPRG